MTYHCETAHAYRNPNLIRSLEFVATVWFPWVYGCRKNHIKESRVIGISLVVVMAGRQREGYNCIGCKGKGGPEIAGSGGGSILHANSPSTHFLSTAGVDDSNPVSARVSNRLRRFVEWDWKVIYIC